MSKILLFLLMLFIISFYSASSETYQEFLKKRRNFLQAEEINSLGHEHLLMPLEIQVNDIIMNDKNEEIAKGLQNINEFLPAFNFFKVSREMENRLIFHLLQKFPKGAALHVHDIGLASADFIVKNITYRDNLYAKFENEDKETIVELKFFEKLPETNWISVNKIREEMGVNYEEWMTKHVTLHGQYVKLSSNNRWINFNSLLTKITPMLTYIPVWRDYFYQSLKEFYEDGVSYLEFRGTLPNLYYLNGTVLHEIETCGIYVEVLKQFKEENPGFFDAKLIYASPRLVSNETFDWYMKTARELKKAYPDFIAGFDLVGQEDLVEPLAKFSKGLFKLKDEIDLFFHAGETKWSGTAIDNNLVDAVLLGAKRIGHGYAITKHPKVAQMIKKNKIGIEVCPISNQIMGLVNDMRDHPLSSMIMENYPIVISSDYPGFWGAKGVTYDWYMTFIGIASANQDLHLLKQLALNSIDQSSLSKEEKQKLLSHWQDLWQNYLEVAIRRSQNIDDNVHKIDIS